MGFRKSKIALAAGTAMLIVAGCGGGGSSPVIGYATDTQTHAAQGYSPAAVCHEADEAWREYTALFQSNLYDADELQKMIGIETHFTNMAEGMTLAMDGANPGQASAYATLNGLLTRMQNDMEAVTKLRNTFSPIAADALVNVQDDEDEIDTACGLPQVQIPPTSALSSPS